MYTQHIIFDKVTENTIYIFTNLNYLNKKTPAFQLYNRDYVNSLLLRSRDRVTAAADEFTLKFLVYGSSP